MSKVIDVVGTQQLRDMIAAVSDQQLGRIINKSIYPAAAILKAETAANLARLPNGESFLRLNPRKPHWGVAADGIRIGKTDGYYGYQVNIMGDPRLWWSEEGTVSRNVKNGAARGAAPEQPFFNPAYRANQSRLERVVQECFEKNIKEAWEKGH